MRNLRPWKDPEPDERDIARSRGALTQAQQDAIHLADIVNAPGWNVLKGLANGTVGRLQAPMPISIDSLIGYLTYSIVRDGIENLLTDAEQVAFNATPKSLPIRSSFEGR